MNTDTNDPVGNPVGPAARATPAHLLSLRDLSLPQWNALLDAAQTLAGPMGRRPLLAGKRFGMLFLNPSLRTRTSFEVACFDLGAHSLYLQPGAGLWQLESRRDVIMDGVAAEHVVEAIGALGTMLDGLGVRAFAGLSDAAEDAHDPFLNAVAQAAAIPVLNLESAMDHPHQGLADALALRRALGAGRPFGSERLTINVRWAPHIKPLPMAVAHGALNAFAREGHEIVVSHPAGCELDAEVTAGAASTAAAAGGSLRVTDDREAALRGAHVVYAKSWGPRTCYGDPDANAAFFEQHRDWIVRAAELDRGAGAGAHFMHCLPVRRGVVVEPGVLDGRRSLVLEQAAARLDVQKATLCRAVGLTDFVAAGNRAETTRAPDADAWAHERKLGVET